MLRMIIDIIRIHNGGFNIFTFKKQKELKKGGLYRQAFTQMPL